MAKHITTRFISPAGGSTNYLMLCNLNDAFSEKCAVQYLISPCISTHVHSYQDVVL